MNYDVNSKIEFSVRKTWVGSLKNREVYYRIKPSELSFFKRIFGNPWRQLYHAYKVIPGVSSLFTPKEFQTLSERLKTFGDICNYIDELNEISALHAEKEAERHAKAVMNGEEWEEY